MPKKHKHVQRIAILLMLLLAMTFVVGQVMGQEPAPTEETVPAEETVEEAVAEVVEGAEIADTLVAEISNLDTVWMLLAAVLVFWMQAGFAMLEAGFVRTKNVVNILMKNFFDFAAASIAYWAIGFGIMFGSGNDFFGSEWFFLSGIPDVFPGLAVPTYAFFFFQLACAGAAATIASGAMAERTEFVAYVFYTVIATAIIYPIVGHWIWGGGWLAKFDTPFYDFAGSTAVHSTGAWIGLMGVIMLGARRGRFGKGSVPMPGQSMPLAMLGVLILWMGWFGFNAGSQLDSDGASIALFTVNTNIAAASGTIVALALGWFLTGIPQLPWALNGALAGLVAVTAPCGIVTPAESVVIGAIGAVVMYGVVVLLEKLELDDPVGAVAVHGGCGVWGTLAVGIFGDEVGLLHGGGADQLITQIIGIVTVAAFVLVSAGVLFAILKAIVGLRVSAEAETIGLDIYEHGAVANPEFTNSPSAPIQSA